MSGVAKAAVSSLTFAVSKQSHGLLIETILGTAAEPELSANADTKERMAHRLKSSAGNKLYGLRKQTVEPVFWNH